MRTHTFRTEEDAGSLRWFGYLYPTDPNGNSIADMSVEASTNGFGFCHAYVKLGSETPVTLALAVPKVFSLWLGFTAGPLRWLKPDWLGYEGRKFGIEASRGQVRVELGTSDDGGSSNRLYLRRRYPREWVRDVAKTRQTPREGRHHYKRRSVKPKSLYGRYLRWRGWLPEVGFEVSVLRYDWRDQVLGPVRRLDEQPVTDLRGIVFERFDGERRPHVRSVVAMPEGNYPCRVALERVTWGRKRWPWSRKTQTHAEVLMIVPVPEPGKGEDSWNIDDDATYSMSGEFRSVAEATAAVAAVAMERRERYGSGLAWVPDAGWPEGIAR